MATVDPLYSSRLQVQADRVRTEGGLGRSDLLIRLFDFLLAQSLAGRSPKEVEIAQDVFGKTADIDLLQDASIRVYIHRLRRKLDEFYAQAAGDGDRLSIPRGEYRLALEAAPAAPDGVAGPADVAMPQAQAGRSPPGARLIPASRRFWIVLALIVLANTLAWVGLFTFNGRDAPFARAAEAPFWRPLATDGLPTVVATGDYYIFGEAPEAMDVTRLVREFSINSHEDLDQYLMNHPTEIGRYVDVNLHYLPTSTGSELRDLLPIVDTAARGHGEMPRVITMSQMNPGAMKGVNIVYVGLLSGLGQLRDPVFEASGFSVGTSYDELIDRKTGKHYMSDWGEASDGHTPRRDYSYIASLPGPAGNHILIIAGTRDAAAMQAAEIASDKRRLGQLAAKLGQASAFEALYEVRTLGGVDLDSKLVLVRPLHVGGVWDPGHAPDQTFPDHMNAAG